MRQRGYSSHRLLDPVPLPLASQYHSTALPSPKRYRKRYEKEVSEESHFKPCISRPWRPAPNEAEGDRFAMSSWGTSQKTPFTHLGRQAKRAASWEVTWPSDIGGRPDSTGQSFLSTPPESVHASSPTRVSTIWQCGPARSEEHTSELQSRQYLVCRL